MRHALVSEPEERTRVQNPSAWLQEWSKSVGTGLATGMMERPGWNFFAREDGVVYHTYSRTSPDRFMRVP